MRSKQTRGATRGWVVACAMATLAAVVCMAATVTAQECASDSDCKPANCCHATACQPTERATACAAGEQCGACDAFTLDCGGRCFCTELKRCAAILNLNSGGNDVTGGAGGGSGAAKKRKYTYGYTKISVKK